MNNVQWGPKINLWGSLTASSKMELIKGSWSNGRVEKKIRVYNNRGYFSDYILVVFKEICIIWHKHVTGYR